MKKPFDLEKAKAGTPIIFRSGDSVTFVTHLPQAKQDHQVVIIDSEGEVEGHWKDGVYAPDHSVSDRDLFLDCPEEVRLRRVEELPRLMLLRNKGGTGEHLVVGFESVSQRIKTSGDAWRSLRSLHAVGYEFRDASRDSSWLKFEVLA